MKAITRKQKSVFLTWAAMSLLTFPGASVAQDTLEVLSGTVSMTGSGGEVGQVIGGGLAVRRGDGSPPNIRFDNPDVGQSYLFQNNNTFSIRDETAGRTPFLMHPGNGSFAFVLRNSRVGLGLNNPSHPIEHTTGAHLSDAGQWVGASSRANKKDIKNLSLAEASTTLAELRPVKWASVYDNVDGDHVGFIAEEVPELVAEPDRKGLSSMKIVGVLTRVVQEQQEAIKALQDRLDELEGKK